MTGEGLEGRNPRGLLAPLKRPYCWVHGHEFTDTVGLSLMPRCRRCGMDHLDHAMLTVFLVLLAAPFVAIAVIVRDAWRSLNDR